MPDFHTPATLPAASVEAILATFGRSDPAPTALIDALGRWLGDSLERAISRARAKPLTQSDVEKLNRAYVRFRDAVEALQDRRNPPPLIPVRDCQTDWDYWIATHEVLGFKRGRRESVDWLLIGELLAFYEVVSPRPASASQPHGPTMRFLKAALSELANQAPSEMRSYFNAPTSGALRQQIGVLTRGYFRFVREDLCNLFE